MELPKLLSFGIYFSLPKQWDRFFCHSTSTASPTEKNNQHSEHMMFVYCSSHLKKCYSLLQWWEKRAENRAQSRMWLVTNNVNDDWCVMTVSDKQKTAIFLVVLVVRVVLVLHFRTTWEHICGTVDNKCEPPCPVLFCLTTFNLANQISIENEWNRTDIVILVLRPNHALESVF